MLEKIQRIFNNIIAADNVVITEKTKLNREAYNLSSFTLIQLICAIEDEFDIEIPNSAITKFKTVKDVIKFIEKNS